MLLLISIPLDGYSTHIHSPVDAHLNYFQFKAIKHGAAVSIRVQVFVGVYAFSSFGYIPRSGMTMLYKNMFNFLRN